MKIKLDENIPARLVPVLAKLGHDTDTVLREKLAGCEDTQIWEGAQKTERFLITQDLGFSNIQQVLPGTHHGVLLVRLRNPGRNAVIRRIENIFQTEDVESWKGRLVVATELKIRVKGPDH